MSISTVASRCAEIQAAITGIEKAYTFAETPNSLKTAVFPCFTNGPVAATYAGSGESHATETRTYQMFLWITPVNRPADAARNAGTIESFIQLVRNAFFSRPALGGLQYVRSATLLGDGGPVILDYAGVAYLAIVFNLEVTEVALVTYAGGD